MLYDLVQKRKGKEIVVMTDELSKVNGRMSTLRSSQRGGIRGQRVEYSVRPSETENKFFQSPHRLNLSGGSKKYTNGRRRATRHPQ